MSLDYHSILNFHKKTYMTETSHRTINPNVFKALNLFSRQFPHSSKVKLFGFEEAGNHSFNSKASQNEPNLFTVINFLLLLSAGRNREGLNNQSYYRVLPSGGGFHPHELYVVFKSKEGMRITHYLSSSNELEFIDGLPANQEINSSSFTLIMTSIPLKSFKKYRYRGWRISQVDAGHQLGSIFESASKIGLTSRPNTTLKSDHYHKMGFDKLSSQGEYVMAAMDFIIAGNSKHESSKDVDVDSKDLPVIVTPPNDLTSIAGDSINHDFSKQLLNKTHSNLNLFLKQDPLLLSNNDMSLNEYTQFAKERRSPTKFSESSPLSPTKLAQLLEGLDSINKKIKQVFRENYLMPVIYFRKNEVLDPGFYCLSGEDTHSELIRNFSSVTDNESVIQVKALKLLRLKGYDPVEFNEVLVPDINYNHAHLFVNLFADFKSLKNSPELYPLLHWQAGLYGQLLSYVCFKNGLSPRGFGGIKDSVMNHHILGQQLFEYQHIVSYAIGTS